MAKNYKAKTKAYATILDIVSLKQCLYYILRCLHKTDCKFKETLDRLCLFSSITQAIMTYNGLEQTHFQILIYKTRETKEDQADFIILKLFHLK